MACVYECNKIGGPWIDVNPMCPFHGYEAQKEERAREEGEERTRRYIEALRDSLATLERIVSHYGANKTEKGLPHPQQQALDTARNLLEKNLEDF
jgi:hypothetical protein